MQEVSFLSATIYTPSSSEQIGTHDGRRRSARDEAAAVLCSGIR